MKFIKAYRPYFILLTFIGVFLTLFFVRYNSSKITIENPKELTEGWMFNDEFITLPVTLEVPKDTPYKIYRKLNHTFNDSQILMIRTSLQDIYVYLDGNLIYEKTYGNSLTQTYASSWHFITLPAQAEGMELMLELSSPYQSMTGRVNHVFYGTEVMHYRYLMRNYGPRLIIGIIVLFIGLVVMISDFFMRNAREKGFVYLGLFAVILSFWMIAESRMLQFFTGSELLMGTLA